MPPLGARRGAGHTDIYLDVDGVLLPVYDPDHPEQLTRGGWSDWTNISRDWGHGAWSPAMVAALASIGNRDDVTVHWCTTWGTKAADDLAPRLGLPAWPVLDPDYTLRRNEMKSSPTGWWKHDAVIEQHAAHPTHNVVWIDDDLSTDEPARDWLHDLSREVATFGVAPDWNLGLTRWAVDAIARFLALVAP